MTELIWWCRTCGGGIPEGDVDHTEIRDGMERLIAETHSHLALDGIHEVIDISSEEHWRS